MDNSTSNMPGSPDANDREAMLRELVIRYPFFLVTHG